MVKANTFHSYSLIYSAGRSISHKVKLALMLVHLAASSWIVDVSGAVSRLMVENKLQKCQGHERAKLMQTLDLLTPLER